MNVFRTGFEAPILFRPVLQIVASNIMHKIIALSMSSQMRIAGLNSHLRLICTVVWLFHATTIGRTVFSLKVRAPINESLEPNGVELRSIEGGPAAKLCPNKVIGSPDSQSKQYDAAVQEGYPIIQMQSFNTNYTQPIA